MVRESVFLSQVIPFTEQKEGLTGKLGEISAWLDKKDGMLKVMQLSC